MAVATEVIRRSMSTLGGLFTKKLPSGIWQFTFNEAGKGMKYAVNGRRYEFLAINGVMGITIDATNEKHLWYFISDDCTVQIEEVGQAANPFFSIPHESGTFTPVLTCVSPGDLAVTYTVRNGFYYNIGEIVYFELAIGINTIAHTTASGRWLISGLPFTSYSGTNCKSVNSVYFSAIDFPASSHLVSVIEPSTATIYFTAIIDNGVRDQLEVADTAIAVGDSIIMSGTYRKA
jgi:hypothetical protein